MNKKISFDNPWIVGIGTAFIASTISDTMQWTAIFSTLSLLIQSGAMWIWNIMISEFLIPVYWLVLIFILPIILLQFLSQVLKATSKKDHPFLQDRSTEISNVRYRWNYEKGDDGLYEVINIIPFCIKDNCQIIYERCPVCDTNYRLHLKQEEEVRVLIKHHLRKKHNFIQP